MFRLRWTCVVLAWGLTTACSGGGAAKVDAPAPVPVTAAPRPVGMQVDTFVDTSRPTPEHGSVPARPSRTLRTTILYPSTSDGGPPDPTGAPYPLIVFAHGSGGFGTGYLPLLRAWASAGYVVAAPAFPVSADGPDGRPGDASSFEDFPNQPGDMAFVITQLLRVNADAGSPLKGMVDPMRIGAAGHSLGAMATLNLAANTCCYDQRLKAAVVLAGREIPISGGTFFTRIRTPVLFVHGDADTNVTYRDGRKAYAEAPPPRFFLTLPGGDHSVMYEPFDGPQAQLAARVTFAFLDAYVKGDAAARDRLGVDLLDPRVGRFESET